MLRPLSASTSDWESIDYQPRRSSFHLGSDYLDRRASALPSAQHLEAPIRITSRPPQKQLLFHHIAISRGLAKLHLQRPGTIMLGFMILCSAGSMSSHSGVHSCNVNSACRPGSARLVASRKLLNRPSITKTETTGSTRPPLILPWANSSVTPSVD